MGLGNAAAAFVKFEDLHDRRVLVDFNLSFRGNSEGRLPSQGLCRLLLSSLGRRLEAFGHIFEFAVTILNTLITLMRNTCKSQGIKRP